MSVTPGGMDGTLLPGCGEAQQHVCACVELCVDILDFSGSRDATSHSFSVRICHPCSNLYHPPTNQWID